MSIKPEYLLAHSDFVRILARSLILDKDQAEDVVQETILPALEKPPSTPKALSSWLDRVVRNFVYALNRSNQRRELREQGAVRSGQVPSPADILEREADRQHVVNAVLDLEPAYRDPIVLRFYENLPPRDIANQLELPVETVMLDPSRTRVTSSPMLPVFPLTLMRSRRKFSKAAMS